MESIAESQHAVQNRSVDAHRLDWEDDSKALGNDLECSDPMTEALPVAPQVLQRLDEFVCSPAFLETLKGARAGGDARFATMQPPSGVQADSPSEQDDFVVLDKSDAVEGMAYFIATYVSSLPEAQNLTPQQLQTALGETFRAVRTSRFRAAWAWGKRVYRYAALGYSAFQMYENPWLIRATIKALWIFSKFAAGATVAALGAAVV